MATAEEMPPPPDSDEEMPGDGGDDEGDEYAQAGATIRHALADKDDEGLAHAICDLFDIHQSKSEPPDDDEQGEKPMGAPGKKPNLAVIIAAGRDKGK